MKSLFVVWHAIDVVAVALLKHEELSRDDLEVLLVAPRSSRPCWRYSGHMVCCRAPAYREQPTRAS